MKRELRDGWEGPMNSSFLTVGAIREDGWEREKAIPKFIKRYTLIPFFSFNSIDLRQVFGIGSSVAVTVPPPLNFNRRG